MSVNGSWNGSKHHYTQTVRASQGADILREYSSPPFVTCHVGEGWRAGGRQSTINYQRDLVFEIFSEPAEQCHMCSRLPGHQPQPVHYLTWSAYRPISHPILQLLLPIPHLPSPYSQHTASPGSQHEPSQFLVQGHTNIFGPAHPSTDSRSHLSENIQVLTDTGQPTVVLSELQWSLQLQPAGPAALSAVFCCRVQYITAVQYSIAVHYITAVQYSTAVLYCNSLYCSTVQYCSTEKYITAVQHITEVEYSTAVFCSRVRYSTAIQYSTEVQYST